MTDIWGEKPTRQIGIDASDFTYKYYSGAEMDAWLEVLRGEYALLTEHSGRWLHFVAVDYPEIKESLSPQKLMELREKAEKWDIIEPMLPKITKIIREAHAVAGLLGLVTKPRSDENDQG